jgi:hypothetical protein
MTGLAVPYPPAWSAVPGLVVNPAISPETGVLNAISDHRPASEVLPVVAYPELGVLTAIRDPDALFDAQAVAAAPGDSDL